VRYSCSCMSCECRYDDFYFLTEPGMLIYSHCPEETSWQLLHPARSRTEYEEYPLVKSFFFSIGMQFLQQNRGIVFTKRGIVTITLGFTQPTAFTFKLTFGETGSDHLQVSVASWYCIPHLMYIYVLNAKIICVVIYCLNN